jgi:hypothetical protein
MQTKTTPTRDQRDKAIAIARDVLLQMEREDNPLGVRAGVYLDGIGRVRYAFDDTDDLQVHIEAAQKHCRVCALGAMMLSAVRLYDGCPIGGLCSSRGVIENVLRVHMSDRAMDMIEAAFEVLDICQLDETTDRDIDFAMTFGSKGGSPVDRLRRIMENVISNDGDFDPGMGEHAVTSEEVKSWEANRDDDDDEDDDDESDDF